MRLSFIGHAAVLIEGPKNVLIDPFFKNNPVAAMSYEKLPKIDFILATHDHFDHFGDAIEVAKRDQATLVAIHELATSAKVAESKVNAIGMNIGGTYEGEDIKISMTASLHSSSLGSPCGFVVEMNGGRVYHSGDTGFFSDIVLIPKLFGKLDAAFLPIAGHYVMDEKQAAMAVKALKPKLSIPIHYNTWPLISANPDLFAKLSKPHKVKILQPGESIEM
jgi:L-ascorbate metabolism protein UlaG (beta-lactamase superfamily)